MIDYEKKPFNLNSEQIKWVEETYAAMTEEERIGQLFCPLVLSTDENELKNLLETKHIGGTLFREGLGAEIQAAHRYLQKESKIPLLTAANLESGGNGSAVEGTFYGREMLVGATGNAERGYQHGKVSCAEGAAVGVNWAFAPVVDLDRNYHNPIINVRTYADNADTVIEMAKGYLKAAAEEGVATSIKHFPGDGIDERDQHLVTSVNYLSVEEWDESYGRVYKELIEAGSLTVMIGHIALPAYEEYFDGKEITKITPATLSKNLLNKLLREKLGFNGMIVTDASPMVGFCSAMDRKTAVPLSIENGCDMFLFNRNFDEDYKMMMDGYHNGILSEARLEEAVKRILATKAAMGLIEKQKNGTLVPGPEALDILSCEKHTAWAKECADEGVTLVKDTQGLLPITPEKHKRVLIEMMGGFESDEKVKEFFTKKLTDEGFEVTIYQNEGFEVMQDSVESFTSKYDLIMYIGNVETVSNKTTARMNWHTMFGLGNNMPWMVHEMPVMFISLGNPYHLLDVPMIKTFINGYCKSGFVMEAVMEKILGRSEFKGKAPVEPFCGRIDLKF